jgi:hypothetical protein
MTDRRLIFFGDSFVAGRKNNQFYPYEKYQSEYALGSINYLDIIQEKTNLNYFHFGYGGSSWWYQRCKMFNYLNKYNIVNDNIDTIIMCHTSPDRINNKDFVISADISYNSSEISDAVKKYLVHLHDDQFNKWAQEMFVNEITNRFENVKIINFICFEDGKRLLDILPGMSFTMPLMAIAMAEMDFNGDIIMSKKYVAADNNKNNHLNEKNNIALAETILWARENYTPGIFDIDLSKFDIKDQKIIDHYKT